MTLVTVAALVVVPSAFAAGTSPSDAQYHSTLTQISAGSSHPPATTVATGSTGGSLPFTGLDVAAMAVVAAGLGIAGLVLRRRVQTSHEDGIR